jgi:hypothetical protein
VPEKAVNSQHLVVTADYFQTLKIPVKAGRYFNDQDNLESVKVAVINETLAHRLWPGENPIGKRFHVWRDEKFSREVLALSAIQKSRSTKRPSTRRTCPSCRIQTGQSHVRGAHGR